MSRSPKLPVKYARLTTQTRSRTKLGGSESIDWDYRALTRCAFLLTLCWVRPEWRTSRIEARPWEAPHALLWS